MAERLGEAYLELTVRNQKMQAGLLNAHQRSMTFTQQIGSSFQHLGSSMATSVATGFAAFTGAQKILNELRAGIERAMQLEGLQTAFENLAGGMTRAENIAQAMNRAFKGTVENVTMLTQANNAMLLGVAKSADEMEFLAMAGRRLAKAVGKDAAFGFESLVTGIGRQSRMMLDNLGIVVKTEEAYEDYAAQLGKTATELTDAEKKQAFLNATMDATREKLSRLGADITTTGERWGKFKTAFSEAFTGIGSAISSVGAALYDMVAGTAQAIAGIDSKAIKEANQAIAELQSQRAKNELELSRIQAERRKREAALKKAEEERHKMLIEMQKEDQKLYKASLERTEQIEIMTLQAEGKKYEAVRKSIELEKKRLLEASKSLDEELAVFEWHRQRMQEIDKQEKEEEVKNAEMAARKKEQIAAEEARQIAQYRQMVQEAIAREQRMKEQVAAWDAKNANLTIRYLNLIGKQRVADLRQLEEWRKSEIEAAAGSVQRLQLIDAVYKAELERIKNINKEISRPQWMGAEELWKRSVALTKGAEPAKTSVSVTAQASKEEKDILKENQEQTRQLRQINDKASFVPRLQ